jgi:hypothetical protein
LALGHAPLYGESPPLAPSSGTGPYATADRLSCYRRGLLHRLTRMNIAAKRIDEFAHRLKGQDFANADIEPAF